MIWVHKREGESVLGYCEPKVSLFCNYFTRLVGWWCPRVFGCAMTWVFSIWRCSRPKAYARTWGWCAILDLYSKILYINNTRKQTFFTCFSILRISKSLKFFPRSRIAICSSFLSIRSFSFFPFRFQMSIWKTYIFIYLLSFFKHPQAM